MCLCVCVSVRAFTRACACACACIYVCITTRPHAPPTPPAPTPHPHPPTCPPLQTRLSRPCAPPSPAEPDESECAAAVEPPAAAKEKRARQVIRKSLHKPSHTSLTDTSSHTHKFSHTQVSQTHKSRTHKFAHTSLTHTSLAHTRLTHTSLTHHLTHHLHTISHTHCFSHFVFPTCHTHPNLADPIDIHIDIHMTTATQSSLPLSLLPNPDRVSRFDELPPEGEAASPPKEEEDLSDGELPPANGWGAPTPFCTPCQPCQ